VKHSKKQGKNVTGTKRQGKARNGNRNLAFDDAMFRELLTILEDLMAQHVSELEGTNAESGRVRRKREPLPLSMQPELDVDWPTEGDWVSGGKSCPIRRDPENPSLHVVAYDDKPGYRFFFSREGHDLAPPPESAAQWTLDDAQQVAKTADAITVLHCGHEDPERVHEAIEHVQTLLNECERLRRIVLCSTTLMVAFDACTGRFRPTRIGSRVIGPQELPFYRRVTRNDSALPQ
jgi:hypothetical protein